MDSLGWQMRFRWFQGQILQIFQSSTIENKYRCDVSSLCEFCVCVVALPPSSGSGSGLKSPFVWQDAEKNTQQRGVNTNMWYCWCRTPWASQSLHSLHEMRWASAVDLLLVFPQPQSVVLRCYFSVWVLGRTAPIILLYIWVFAFPRTSRLWTGSRSLRSFLFLLNRNTGLKGGVEFEWNRQVTQINKKNTAIIMKNNNKDL